MPIVLGPKQMIVIPDLPVEADELFGVEPNTFAYLIHWNDTDGAVTVEGFTTTGHAWTHTGKVSAEWFIRFVGQPPFSSHALSGSGADTGFIVYAISRKAMMLRIADLIEIRSVVQGQISKAEEEGRLASITPNSLH